MSVHLKRSWSIFKVKSFSGYEGSIVIPGSWFYFMVLLSGSVSFSSGGVHKLTVYGCLVETFLGLPVVVAAIKSLPFDEVFIPESSVLGWILSLRI